MNYFIPVAGLNHYLGSDISEQMVAIKVGEAAVMQHRASEKESKQIGVVATNKFDQLKKEYNDLARFCLDGEGRGEDFKILTKAELISMFPIGSTLYAEVEYYGIDDDKNILILDITHEVKTRNQELKQVDTKVEERKETTNMNLDLQNLGIKFGKAPAAFKLSINGIAVKGQGNDYFVWDQKSSTLINVSSMVFDFDALYLMPSKDVKVGDTILHGNSAVSVTEVTEGVVSGVRYSDQTIVRIPAMKNIFGFNFYTKVVNLFGDGLLGGLAGESKDGFNPMMLLLLTQNGGNFGDLGQMMLMSQLGGNLFKL